MHEFSIAEGILATVTEELEKVDVHPARLRQVQVEVGRMRQVIPETLEFAFQQMASEEGCENVELVVEVKPVRAVCPECSWEGELEEMVFVCPECGSQDLEVTSGKELQLTRLEYEDI